MPAAVLLQLVNLLAELWESSDYKAAAEASRPLASEHLEATRNLLNGPWWWGTPHWLRLGSSKAANDPAYAANDVVDGKAKETYT